MILDGRHVQLLQSFKKKKAKDAPRRDAPRRDAPRLAASRRTFQITSAQRRAHRFLCPTVQACLSHNNRMHTAYCLLLLAQSSRSVNLTSHPPTQYSFVIWVCFGNMCTCVYCVLAKCVLVFVCFDNMCTCIYCVLAKCVLVFTMFWQNVYFYLLCFGKMCTCICVF